MVFSAPEFAALGKHIAAAAAFSNNFLLWFESGYFDTAAVEKPLLHLWSLGIEEQFYLLVPAVLWISAKGLTGSVRWVARLGALSLLATILLSNFDYNASFYLLHTRFWELAAGVVLAQAELRIVDHAQRGRIRSLAKRDVREILVFSFAIVLACVLVLEAGDAESRPGLILRDSGLCLGIVIAAVAAFLADRYAHVEAQEPLRLWWTQNGNALATTSSVAGITLIGASLALLGSDYWPGAQALFPVVRSTLLIAAAPMAPFNRLIAWRPLAFIGGISYPLYLWHWPAIVISRLMSPGARGIALLIPLAASFVLAWLTKAFLEDPVRLGRFRLAVFRRPPLWPVVAGLVMAGSLGSIVALTNGIPSRFPPGLRAIAEWSEVNPDVNWRVGHCYFYLNSTQDFSSECTPVKRPGVPLILLWGDSHAAHLYPGMAKLQSMLPLDIAQWTSAGCPPTLKPMAGEPRTCPKRRAAALMKIGQLDPDTIVLGGAWERYLEIGRSQDEILGAVSETIRHLKSLGSRRIVVFGPGPLWNTTLAIDLFRFMARSRSSEIPARLGNVTESLWRLDAAMAAEAIAENAQYVSVLNYFCDETGCLTVGDKHRRNLTFYIAIMTSYGDRRQRPDFAFKTPIAGEN